jgi:RND family efflux transporter MFP subunit
MTRAICIAAAAAWLSAAVACRRVSIPATTSPATAGASATKVSDFRTTLADEGLLGIVVAPETVDVASQLEGRLKEIRVRTGDSVERDDVVAKLDTLSARQELAIARADLAVAKSDRDRSRLELAQAEERLRRRETVIELPTQTVGTVSDEERSTSRYQRELAAVRVAAAEAAVASKQSHFEQLRALVAEGFVRAPFSGRVTTRYADVGTLLHKGVPIVRIIGTGELRVRFAIPEEQASRIVVGMPLRIAVGTASLTGAVEKVAPEIDASSRMVFAEASLARDPRQPLRSGQVAHVFVAPQLASATR